MSRGRGAVAWYPVHCTSINNTNSLISGDNKGVAAQFMEEWAAKSSRDGNATVSQNFVASFGQSNVGDTSPNILGAFCYDTGEALLSPWCLHGDLQAFLCLVEDLGTYACKWESAVSIIMSEESSFT